MRIGTHEIKAAIFDVDGTIFDSMPFWMIAADKYLDKLGVKHSPGVGLKFLSLNVEEGALFLQNDFLSHLTLQQIIEGIADVMTEVYAKKVEYKKDAKEFMQYLHKQNIPIVIATATDRTMMQGGLDRFAITPIVKNILTCTECNTSKKYPDIYLKAATLCQAKPEETVVFEDAVHAINTAKNAGFVVVGIEDEASAKDKNEIIKKVDYYIKDFSEIWRLV